MKPAVLPFIRSAILALTVQGVQLLAMDASAQEPAEPQPANPYTLHVYANRIQLPTLVIDAAGHQVPSLTRDKFDITLDGGSVFHPSAARIAGDDPITLAVLLDVSGKGKDILKNFAGDFSALAPGSIHPKDHISVFAVDCHVIRSLDDVPADPVTLKLGIEKALVAPSLHGEHNEPACGNSVHLWDAIAIVSNALSTKPGRRVMLVVSPGIEFSSKYSPEQVSDFAGQSGIAIFGMRDREESFYRREQPTAFVHNGGLDPTISPDVLHDDRLEEMCRKNGGVVLNVAYTRLPQHLQEFVALLRSRYIIEYPRPDEARAGKHTIVLSVHGSNDLVLSTGASTPLPDPGIAADPNTVPSAPSPASFGNKRPPK